MVVGTVGIGCGGADGRRHLQEGTRGNWIAAHAAAVGAAMFFLFMFLVAVAFEPPPLLFSAAVVAAAAAAAAAAAVAVATGLVGGGAVPFPRPAPGVAGGAHRGWSGKGEGAGG